MNGLDPPPPLLDLPLAWLSCQFIRLFWVNYIVRSEIGIDNLNLLLYTCWDGQWITLLLSSYIALQLFREIHTNCCRLYSASKSLSSVCVLVLAQCRLLDNGNTYVYWVHVQALLETDQYDIVEWPRVINDICLKLKLWLFRIVMGAYFVSNVNVQIQGCFTYM